MNRERQQIGDGHVAWYGGQSDLGPLRVHYLDPTYRAASGAQKYGDPCRLPGP